MRKVLLLFSLLLSVYSTQAQDTVTLTLAAYTTPREAYVEIIPLFQEHWQQQTGQRVTFQESYLGSGAQSRAVAGGFEADIVALSLERDITRLQEAGLITHDWQDNPYNGMVSTSLVVIVVRPGNPLDIQDWADLVRPGIEVLTPDPATSGGAQWNVMAAYGAAQRGHVPGYEASDEGAAQYLTDLFRNVSVMSGTARESVLTFSYGIGDAMITYENEFYAGIAVGDQYDIIYPQSTILIENPAALVDAYVNAHDTREIAEAFVAFLYTPEAQAIFAEKGYRPPVRYPNTDTNSDDENESPTLWDEETLDLERFPLVDDIFTIADLGGWESVAEQHFSADGTFARVMTALRR